MTEQPLLIHGWSNAILHVDADAFFASCEQATNPALKGKPVAVGKERGIATAVSYEAKKRGVTRGMRLSEIKRFCPEALIINSDYEKYSLFSVRMFEILKSFSPLVEEYSIDEAFVDLTGLRRAYHCSYEEIGMKIKETIKRELGITVSVGISLTKVLAKVASKHHKPDGLTAISGRKIHIYLKDLPLDKIWGIGANTSAYCQKLGINTALEFARKPEGFIKRHFSKPFYEIWHELNGKSIYPVNPKPKENYKSISKAKTFKPTSERDNIYAHLLENLEKACFKARRYELQTKKVVIFLKTQDYKERVCEIKLSGHTAYPEDIFPFIKEAFEAIYEDGIFYRQTGAILLDLTSMKMSQRSLFDDLIKAEKIERLYNTVDSLNIKFGRNILLHGATIKKGNNQKSKQSLGIPILKIEV